MSRSDADDPKPWVVALGLPQRRVPVVDDGSPYYRAVPIRRNRA